MKKVAYYKGCLASLSAKELDSSTQALAPKVGLELEELESVTCCGAGDIHEAEPDYYLHLNARILAYAEATGSDTLMTICNVCTLNLRQANFQLQGDHALLERVNQNLRTVGVPAYTGAVDVKHFLWLVADGEGYELLKEAAHKGLKGLKVAPFYGCQILRPSKLLGFEDPDRPWSLEAIIEACGGEAIDYPAKIKCCGFPIIQAREETGCDTLMTICNVCTLNLRQANWQLKNDESLLRRVSTNLEAVGAPPYTGGVEVKHLLWLIAEGDGYELLKTAAHKGLKGLRVAPFYGCQILRPSKVLGFEDPDRPWSLEAIIEACGGEAIDYPAKIKCCGFPIIQAREEVALGELIQPIEQATEAGADAMVTPCPLCHLSLDAWQSKLREATGKDFQMPILHLSQLIGVAAGLEESELQFKRHVVPVDPVVEKLQV